MTIGGEMSKAESRADGLRPEAMSSVVDVVVIGAGVVGLAAARELSLAGLEVLILEQHRSFGHETSSRNSEVIHAGLYYPRGSLKARGCIEGRKLLYEYCARHHVPHRRSGKMIVTTDHAQLGLLSDLYRRAKANGLSPSRLSGADARRLEPALRAVAVLMLEESGIIDSHAYMLSLLGGAEAAGATLVCNTKVERVTRQHGRHRIWIAGEAAPAVDARWVVNAAGLRSTELADRIEGLPAAPELHYAKGTYFSYAGKAPFERLIYPLPEPGGLGIHLTLDLAGGARLGPDVEWVDRPSWEVDESKRETFAAAAACWWPLVDPEKLVPGFVGIRPKLSARGEVAADFRVDMARTGADAGLVALYGIESPGLTASLWLGRHVRDLVLEGSCANPPRSGSTLPPDQALEG